VLLPALLRMGEGAPAAVPAALAEPVKEGA
jgi:hypothetical protein